MTAHATIARPLALMLLLAGCAVGPDYRPPTAADLKVPERFNAAPDTTGQVDLARWWQGFDDPVLNQLVERALDSNLDIEAAGARLRQARASLRGAQGEALPSIGASGSAGRTIGSDRRTIVDPGTGQTFSSGGDRTQLQAGIDASWEADLFGGIRRSIEAARGDAEARRNDLHFAQLSVASEVGLNYLDARLAQQRLRIARENLASQDETLQIVGWRVQAGLVSSLDLEQARQLRAQTAASIPPLETGYTQAVNRIAVLLGEAPGAVNSLMATPRAIPLAPAASDIPARVIQRRPDVASAERTLAAETARIGVATAELYPALNLSGSFSGSAASLAALPESAIGNIIAGITAPIFQGGRIRAAIEGQRASADAALAAYRSSVLMALEDVENALTALGSAGRREIEVARSAEAARNAAILARSQYRAGLIDFQALLEAERSLLSTQDAAATARADRATATVQLYKALGGGWEAAPLPASAGQPRAPTTLTASSTRP